MNEFVVKKLAGVQAFIDLSNQISNKGGVPLAQEYPEVARVLQTASEYTMPVIAGEFKDVFDAKTQKTLTKLGTMMDLYVGDSWDDPVEILEWLSFYAGSASAHAALVAGALQKEGNAHADDIAELSDLLWRLLTDVRLSLADTGARRA